jgi:hypothetical protein
MYAPPTCPHGVSVLVADQSAPGDECPVTRLLMMNRVALMTMPPSRIRMTIDSRRSTVVV